MSLLHSLRLRAAASGLAQPSQSPKVSRGSSFKYGAVFRQALPRFDWRDLLPVPVRRAFHFGPTQIRSSSYIPPYSSITVHDFRTLFGVINITASRTHAHRLPTGPFRTIDSERP